MELFEIPPAALRSHFDSIQKYENVIENRGEDDGTAKRLTADNKKVLEQCRESGQEVLLIDGEYNVEPDLP